VRPLVSGGKLKCALYYLQAGTAVGRESVGRWHHPAQKEFVLGLTSLERLT
jgi:hypothetical protein